MLAKLAGSVGIKLGIRPTVLLEMDDGWFENLLMDAAILEGIYPSAPGEPGSLMNDIFQKRRRWMKEFG